MRQHVRIRMPEQSKTVRNLHAADDELSALCQTVYVIAVSDPEISHQNASFCCAHRRASATAKSSGVVSLILE